MPNQLPLPSPPGERKKHHYTGLTAAGYVQAAVRVPVITPGGIRFSKGNVNKLKGRNVCKMKGRNFSELKGCNVYKLKGRNVYKMKGRSVYELQGCNVYKLKE